MALTPLAPPCGRVYAAFLSDLAKRRKESDVSARYLLGTTITIVAADVVVFSAIILGLNYSRLLNTQGEADPGAILAFWNCPWSIAVFVLFVVTAGIHVLACVIFLRKTLSLLNRICSRMQKKEQICHLHSSELARISESLAKDKTSLQHSQKILARFMKHANPIPCGDGFNLIKSGKN